MRRREFFRIEKFRRRYDRKAGNFVFNIAYKTAVEMSPRTVAVAEAFGLGIDEEKEFNPMIKKHSKRFSVRSMKTILRMKCSHCGRWNRVPANRIFIEQPSSEPKGRVMIPMYEPLEVAKCKKCGKVIAEPKELIRIRHGV